MFYFRVNKIKVIDNHAQRMHFGLFGPDRANVQLISFVTTGDQQLPNLAAILGADTEAERNSLLAEAAKEVASSRILTPIENVKDNHILRFGDTGFVLHRNERIPEDFSWTLLAVKVGSSTEEGQERLGREIEKHPDLPALGRRVASLAGFSNVGFTALVEVTRFIANVLSGDSDDRQIGLLYMTLTRVEHYPHGERKKDDVSDLTGNLLIDYSLFGI